MHGVRIDVAFASFKWAAYGSLALLLASCSSTRAPQPVAPVQQPSGAIRFPGRVISTVRIRMAHPGGMSTYRGFLMRYLCPHYGPVKASPYTVFGKQYYPIPDARRYQAVGPASWYGTKFHGQATANGETYDLYGMTAAHKNPAVAELCARHPTWKTARARFLRC